MAVVMGIIAVLFSLAASSFSSYRRQATLDASAETILSLVREAQNNSFAVREGEEKPNTGIPTPTGCSSKAWGVLLAGSGNSVNLWAYFNCTNAPYTDQLKGKVQGNTITLDIDSMTGQITNGTNSTPANDAYITFTTPLARPYLTRFATFDGFYAAAASSPYKDSYFKTSDKPTKEWVYANPSGGVNYDNYFDSFKYPGYRLEYTLTKGSATRKVIIYQNGDAEIQ